MANNTSHVVWFEELRRADVPRVGGKNASLGEVGNLATLWREGATWISRPPQTPIGALSSRAG